MEGDYRRPHLTDTGQKSLTVKATQSVTLMMHKLWKFITPNIITEHTEDPGALCSPYCFCLSLFLHPLILTVSLFLPLLLKMMKDWGANSHHYTPQTPTCVMVGPVKQNNGHLLRLLKPWYGTVKCSRREEDLVGNKISYNCKFYKKAILPTNRLPCS